MALHTTLFSVAPSRNPNLHENGASMAGEPTQFQLQLRNQGLDLHPLRQRGKIEKQLELRRRLHYVGLGHGDDPFVRFLKQQQPSDSTHRHVLFPVKFQLDWDIPEKCGAFDYHNAIHSQYLRLDNKL